MGLPEALDVANMPSSRLLRRYARGTVAYTVYEGGRYRAVAEGDGMFALSPHMLPFGVGAGLAAMVVPAISRARNQARLIRDRNNLNQLAMGFATYLNEHGDNRFYPSGIGELFDKGVLQDKGVLISPLDRNPPKLPNGLPCSYVSCFDRHPKREFRDDFPPNLIMAWDRQAFIAGRRNVMFFDSHVEAIDEARFQELLRQLDEQVKRGTKPRVPKAEF
jgi:prepilin-type processing-associated H-X9-DG protein